MASAAATRYENCDASPKRVVLLVEDEVIIRSLVAEHLRECAFTVIEAANAEEAITVLSSQAHIDLVFSDITMPGEMDGLALVRWIRQRSPRMPVILTSGAGVVLNSPAPFTNEEFVRKPYDLDELEIRLRAILDKN